MIRARSVASLGGRFTCLGCSAAPPEGLGEGLGGLGALGEFQTPILGAHVFSGWGRPRSGRNGVHEGIDIEAQPGTAIFSIGAGELEGPFREEFAGLFVRVKHDNGFTSRYMHLSDVVAPAGRVFGGQLIAHSGTSGTTGGGTPHLHFDLHLQRELLDQYTAAFGRPRVGFPGTCRAFGCAVPSEPMVPVASYSQRTIDDARRNNVPLFRPPKKLLARALPIAGAVAITYLALR